MRRPLKADRDKHVLFLRLRTALMERIADFAQAEGIKTWAGAAEHLMLKGLHAWQDEGARHES